MSSCEHDWVWSSSLEVRYCEKCGAVEGSEDAFNLFRDKLQSVYGCAFASKFQHVGGISE